MDPDAQARQERDMEQVRREIERKSHDTWRVFNPLDESVNYPPSLNKTPYVDKGTFIFFYDGYPNRIAPKSTKDMEFFKVRVFFQAMANFMIGQLQLIKGEDLMKKHDSLGQGGYLDKYVENVNVWDKVPRLNDPVLLGQIRDQVILGLVEEYGLELEAPKSAESTRVDTRSLHDQVLGAFSKKLAPEVVLAKEELKKEVQVDQ